jgi:hypothetical protein
MFVDLLPYVQRVDERDWNSLQVERRIETTVLEKYQDLTPITGVKHYLHLQWRDLRVKIDVPSSDYHDAVKGQMYEIRCYEDFFSFDCTYPAYFDNGAEVWSKLIIPFWLGVFLLLVIIGLLITSIYRRRELDIHNRVFGNYVDKYQFDEAKVEEMLVGTMNDKPISPATLAKQFDNDDSVKQEERTS